MRGPVVALFCLALVACAGTRPPPAPVGTLQGLVDTQQSVVYRLPGRFRTVITHAGISRSGDLGYTHGRWSLRVDELPQFSDAQGQFISVWMYTADGWRPLADGRVSQFGTADEQPRWSGTDDAAGTVRSRGSLPPSPDESVHRLAHAVSLHDEDAPAAASSHVHGMQVADSGDIAVQWGEHVLHEGGRADWILVWHHTEDGWRVRYDWSGPAH
jgi:hypothetical protein